MGTLAVIVRIALAVIALFFVFSSAQTGKQPSDKAVLLFASLATLAMGALVEIAEGATGAGNCRLRDLIPDSAGIVLGVAALILWRKLRHASTLNPLVAPGGAA